MGLLLEIEKLSTEYADDAKRFFEKSKKVKTQIEKESLLSNCEDAMIVSASLSFFYGRIMLNCKDAILLFNSLKLFYDNIKRSEKFIKAKQER